MKEFRVLFRHRSGLVPASPQFLAIHAKGTQFRLQPDTFSATVDEQEYNTLIREPAVDVYPDVRLAPCVPLAHLLSPGFSMSGLAKVLELIEAPGAWQVARGSDVYIAIVDTGICGSMSEFPQQRRAGGWSFDGSDPWADYYGHGSMVACVAAASDDQGGKGSGVAPNAMVYSCKTSFLTSELIKI